MPRRATGTVEHRPAKGETPSGWWGKATDAAGKRTPWRRLGSWANSAQGRARAQETIAAYSERLRAGGLAAVPAVKRRKPPTNLADAHDWWKAYALHRTALGLDPSEGEYKTHIKPVIDKPWADVTREDCKQLRNALDVKARAGECSTKTGFNAWTVWTTAAKAASGTWKRDKAETLKRRDDNPCVGVTPPDLDDGKELQWLYPDEFLKLVSCEDIPLAARRLYAVGLYLFVRAGELKALTWSDVDVERGIVSIRHSFDRETGEVKGTKTGNRGMRRFAIEANALPLLRAMHAEANGEGPLVSMRMQKWWAADLRRHLELAGVKRAALFTTDATRKRLRFHDLRSSSLTWMAIRGDDHLKIQQRAGHTSFLMTQKYIRCAEAVGEAIGNVFPALPDSLISGLNRTANRTDDPQVLVTTVEAPGIETRWKCGISAGFCRFLTPKSSMPPPEFPGVLLAGCTSGSTSRFKQSIASHSGLHMWV